MRLIIGLGNPGEKYRNNRHNVGYMVLDALTSRISNSKFLISNKLITKKTDCFMNESGKYVKKLVEQYRVSLSNLWVIHDDLDIPLGSYKIQFGRGPRQHNGLLSVYDTLGTKDFWHVRVGIENRHDGVGKPSFAKATEGKDYVLQDFTKEEREILAKSIDKLLINLIDLISK